MLRASKTTSILARISKNILPSSPHLATMHPRTKKPRLASNAPRVRLASSAAQAVQPPPAIPAQTDASRHVSRSRFADAPISDDLKKGIKHECVPSNSTCHRGLIKLDT